MKSFIFYLFTLLICSIILYTKCPCYNFGTIITPVYGGTTKHRRSPLYRNITFLNRINTSKKLNRRENSTFHSQKDDESKLDRWKFDLADIPGPWKIFLPFQLTYAHGLYPNPDIRPTLLFCDISGRVCGPQHPDSPYGAYLLDSKDSEIIDDDNNYIHSRKCVMILLSAKDFSNLRLVLAGRIFYSKNHIVNELMGAIKMRSAVFIGQSFLESYDNECAKEALLRFKRKVTMLDQQGNEIDPINWKSQPLESIGSPFRWLHGNDEWKLLGPFVAYRSLGGKGPVKHDIHIFEKYEESSMYNIIDPFEVNCRNFTSTDNIESDVHTLVSSVFKKNDGLISEIRLNDPEYIAALEQEMVKLGLEGPKFYKNSME